MMAYNPDEFFNRKRKLTKKLTKEKRQLTNADRIRAMTDEELAEVISECCPDGYEWTEGCFEGDCPTCWLDWLQREAAE